MKYTVQEAQQILGVTKTSSKEEIEKKYDVVLRKHRIMKMEGTLNEDSEADFQKSTDAYRILMGYEVDQPVVERRETYTDKALDKVGIDRKKADNFFHYHKYHILGIGFAVVLIIITVMSFVNRVKPDVTIGLLGLVNNDAQQSLTEKIKKEIPEIKEVAYDTAILSGDVNDTQSVAYAQKAMVLLAASDIDVFLVNKYVFDNYAANGAFMALDDVARDFEIDVSKSQNLKLRVVEEWETPSELQNFERKPKKYLDEEPRLYGIDVTNSEFFKDINIVGPENVLVIRYGPKNYDMAMKLLRLFAK